MWCSSNSWSSALAFPLDFILKSDVLLARHVFYQEGLRDKGSCGHSGLRVVPGHFLRNSKASELLKRAKITTRVSPSSRVAIFTRARVIRFLYYSWVHLNISVAGEGVGKERKMEVFPLPLFLPFLCLSRRLSLRCHWWATCTLVRSFVEWVPAIICPLYFHKTLLYDKNNHFCSLERFQVWSSKLKRLKIMGHCKSVS